MDEILTAIEAAELLKVHKRTVYRLAEEGVIPGTRIGHRWRFSKKNILALVAKPEIEEAPAQRNPAVNE
ncbi:MAG TPA: helix-turn-helix domain-containing protein [Candidatus Binatia bacterium]|jgi:excisionase family DNA binding protein|nr:helix-turn-helix domain-containing protein [Candidatus Binatia bacterium]